MTDKSALEVGLKAHHLAGVRENDPALWWRYAVAVTGR
jgi:hypothetical protein